jgi:hypothetical protein
LGAADVGALIGARAPPLEGAAQRAVLSAAGGWAERPPQASNSFIHWKGTMTMQRRINNGHHHQGDTT